LKVSVDSSTDLSEASAVDILGDTQRLV